MWLGEAKNKLFRVYVIGTTKTPHPRFHKGEANWESWGK